jgi:hypothetical protein
MLETCFKAIAQEIFDDINRTPEGEDVGWEFEKLVYKECPNLLTPLNCGNNPCSCSNNKKPKEDNNLMF